MAVEIPPGKRDLVRFEGNERVDRGDVEALQRNCRSESRTAHDQFVFGNGSKIRTDAGAPIEITERASGILDTVTNWSRSAGVAFWLLSPIAGTAVRVEPTPDSPSGAITGVDRDGTVAEKGFPAGLDGPASLTLSLVGKAAGLYGVYIAAALVAAEPGIRVFHNGTTGDEDRASIDTRKVATWTATVHLLGTVGAITGVAPGGQYTLLGLIDWSGAAILSLWHQQNTLFEGLFDTYDGGAGPPGIAYNANNEWGDGVNDRSLARDASGLTSFKDWSAAMRRQVRDIINSDPTKLWVQEVPKTATVSPAGPIGTKIDLERTREHIEKTTDPHGAMTLTQTNLLDGAGALLRAENGGRIESASSGGAFKSAGAKDDAYIFSSSAVITANWQTRDRWFGWEQFHQGPGQAVDHWTGFTAGSGRSYISWDDNAATVSLRLRLFLAPFVAAMSIDGQVVIESIDVYVQRRDQPGVSAIEAVNADLLIWESTGPGLGPNSNTLLTSENWTFDGTDIVNSTAAGVIDVLAHTIALSEANRNVGHDRVPELHLKLDSNAAWKGAAFYGARVRFRIKSLQP